MIHFERLNKETEDLIIRVGESAIRYNRIIAAAPVQNPVELQVAMNSITSSIRITSSHL